MPRVRRGRIARSFRDAASTAMLLPRPLFAQVAARARALTGTAACASPAPQALPGPSARADRPLRRREQRRALSCPLSRLCSHTLAHTHPLFPFRSRSRASATCCWRDADPAARSTPRAPPYPSAPLASRARYARGSRSASVSPAAPLLPWLLAAATAPITLALALLPSLLQHRPACCSAVSCNCAQSPSRSSASFSPAPTACCLQFLPQSPTYAVTTSFEGPSLRHVCGIAV
jgi:hypothetical protein